MASEMDDTICHWMRPAARLRVHGEDAAAFLQGQFSNDLCRRDEHPATYGLWLNHKGRVLADSHVLQRGPSLFEIVSLTSPAALIRERLEAYIVADDVVVEDRTEGFAAVVLAGPGATTLVHKLGAEGAGAHRFVDLGDAVVLPARGGSHTLVCSSSETTRWGGALRDAGVREVGSSELAWHRVAAGVPSVPDELGPEDLPMEGGLEHDAISFTKGCYLGQEVMARLHNLGQVRRQLFVVRLDPTGVLAPKGAALHVGGQKVGELRVACPSPRPGVYPALGLAMLQVQATRPGMALALEPHGVAQVIVERLAEGSTA